ncbi:hypothetical protein [Azohydromonas lata]|uniref:Uncharacterized protein n=1 Tax=Azohydromonas lata TaxID=45677 RepID=A0ABU5I8P8_9BURK|nr:hypothetical protein [Azohydromonas lata]MDZ5455474.1 hypothetical protein [Azohydromonas lata]
MLQVQRLQRRQLVDGGLHLHPFPLSTPELGGERDSDKQQGYSQNQYFQHTDFALHPRHTEKIQGGASDSDAPRLGNNFVGPLAGNLLSNTSQARIGTKPAFRMPEVHQRADTRGSGAKAIEIKIKQSPWF